MAASSVPPSASGSRSISAASASSSPDAPFSAAVASAGKSALPRAASMPLSRSHPHGRLVLALDQAAMHGAVEHLVDGTQVLPDLIDLADDVSEELQIRIGAR